MGLLYSLLAKSRSRRFRVLSRSLKLVLDSPPEADRSNNNAMLYTATISSPIGNIAITCDDRHLLALRFTSSKAPKTGTRRHPLIAKTVKQLKEYFAGRRKKFALPVSLKKLQGTPFQKHAWRALMKVSYGKVITYKNEARMIGSPKACRAAGSANGKNPIAIVIPCHRVVAANGMGGYSSGVWRKKKLLAAELGGNNGAETH